MSVPVHSVQSLTPPIGPIGSIGLIEPWVRFGERASQDEKNTMGQWVSQHFENDMPDDRLFFTLDWTHHKDWSDEKQKANAAPLLSEMVKDIASVVAAEQDKPIKTPFASRIGYFLVLLRKNTKEQALKGIKALKPIPEWHVEPRRAVAIDEKIDGQEAILVRQMFSCKV